MKLKKYHLLLLLAFTMLMSCSPKSSYMVLSFFFDGVPDYTKKDLHKNDTIHVVKSAKIIASALPVKEIPKVFYHKPYTDRSCNLCHEKGVNNKSLKDQPGMCYQCHKDFKDTYQYVHGPVAGGYCSACHSPHQSTLPKLLKLEGQKMCLKCHAITRILKNPVHSNIGNTDCTTCHNPHGGATRFVLK